MQGADLYPGRDGRTETDDGLYRRRYAETLEPKQLRRLLSHIQTTFDFTWVKEYTVEAGRPDSITREKLQVMKEFPVTRISVNPQTMNQKTLDVIGRKHTVKIRSIFSIW